MRNRLLLIFVVLVLLSGLMAGCQSAPDEKGPADVVGTLVVAFDGQTCAVQGPESVPSGKVIVHFNNQSELTIMVGFYRLTDGKTWEDLTALIGEPGSSVSVPEWVKGPVNTEVLPGVYWEDDFPVNPGKTYALVCLDMANQLAWPGAPLAIEP